MIEELKESFRDNPEEWAIQYLQLINRLQQLEDNVVKLEGMLFKERGILH